MKTIKGFVKKYWITVLIFAGLVLLYYYAADVKERYQVTPKEFIDLKALMGDTADNIPGLPGVGEKTATKILLQYETLENAHAHFEEIKPNKAKEAMRDHYDLAELSKKTCND